MGKKPCEQLRRRKRAPSISTLCTPKTKKEEHCRKIAEIEQKTSDIKPARDWPQDFRNSVIPALHLPLVLRDVPHNLAGLAQLDQLVELQAGHQDGLLHLLRRAVTALADLLLSVADRGLLPLSQCQPKPSLPNMQTEETPTNHTCTHA